MITRQLADFAAALDFDTLPVEVTARAKQLLLDLTGISLRAWHDTDSTAPMRRALERLGMADGESIVIGDARGYVPSAAALLNGATSTVLCVPAGVPPVSAEPSG